MPSSGVVIAAERADLLREFEATSFHELATTVPRANWSPVPAITLLGLRYQNVTTERQEAQLSALIQRIREVRTRALSHTHFLLKAGPPRKISIGPWPFANVRLEGLSERQQRVFNLKFHPYGPQPLPADLRALEEPLPDEFIQQLPVKDLTAPPGSLLAAHVYFREEGRIYRVASDPHCVAGSLGLCRTFLGLDAREIRGIDAALRALDPTLEQEMGLTLDSGEHLWSSDLGPALASLPPEGATIRLDQYERHRTAYFAILRTGRFGVRLLDGDLFFEKVRLCYIERGTPEECEIQ